jgi:hypothetical protein
MLDEGDGRMERSAGWSPRSALSVSIARIAFRFSSASFSEATSYFSTGPPIMINPQPEAGDMISSAITATRIGIASLQCGIQAASYNFLPPRGRARFILETAVLQLFAL